MSIDPEVRRQGYREWAALAAEDIPSVTAAELEAAVVAAALAEREACAEVAEKLTKGVTVYDSLGQGDAVRDVARVIAMAIRARRTR